MPTSGRTLQRACALNQSVVRKSDRHHGLLMIKNHGAAAFCCLNDSAHIDKIIIAGLNILHHIFLFIEPKNFGLLILYPVHCNFSQIFQDIMARNISQHVH